MSLTVPYGVCDSGKHLEKMKAVKLETGETPVLRGMSRARYRFQLHHPGLAPLFCIGLF
jgi:hypothetical protein